MNYAATLCSCCGQYSFLDKVQPNIDGKYYCIDCLKVIGFKCFACNKYHLESERINKDYYNHYELQDILKHCYDNDAEFENIDNEVYNICEDCFNDKFFVCDSCESIHYSDSMCYSEILSQGLCEDCT